jgi:hypothetical protein
VLIGLSDTDRAGVVLRNEIDLERERVVSVARRILAGELAPRLGASEIVLPVDPAGDLRESARTTLERGARPTARSPVAALGSLPR